MKPRWGKKVTDGETGEGCGYATVDGNQNSVLTHQLRLVKYPIISQGFIHHRWLLGISSINSMCREV